MSISRDIVKQIKELPPSAAIALNTNVDGYIEVLRAALDMLPADLDLECIYITTSLPSQSIQHVLKLLEVDMDRVHFIDCISQIMVGATTNDPRIQYVESPTMLENIMIKVEYLTRRSNKPNLVLLDSMNSLAIHNNIKILSEFLHIMVNNLRAKEAYTLIMYLEEEGAEEIARMLNLVCDASIDVTTMLDSMISDDED